MEPKGIINTAKVRDDIPTGDVLAVLTFSTYLQKHVPTPVIVEWVKLLTKQYLYEPQRT